MFSTSFTKIHAEKPTGRFGGKFKYGMCSYLYSMLVEECHAYRYDLPDRVMQN